MSKVKGIWFYIKSYKFNSMFTKSFLLVLLVFLIPFSITGYFYYNNTKTMLYSEIIYENASQTSRIREVSDTMIKQADYILANILNTDNVQMFMVNDWFVDQQPEDGSIIKTVPLIYDNIDSVYIYSKLNQSVLTNTGLSSFESQLDRNWYPTYQSIDNRDMVMVPRTKNDIFPQYISVMKAVYIDNENKGAVIVNMNMKKLMKMLLTDEEEKGQNVFIVDRGGRILACSDKQYFGGYAKDIDLLKDIPFGKGKQTVENTINNIDHIASVEYSDNYGLTYINIMSMDAYQDKLSYTIRFLIVLIFVLIFVSLFVAWIIAFNSFKPVREIITVLEEPDRFYDSNVGVRTGNLNELKYIVGSILETLQLNTEMKKELEERLSMLDKSHFSMLQTQINPHFLYNTLETINWMAVSVTKQSKNPVSNAISNLAELFRMNTESTNYLIPLEEEIRQTKLYIDILKLRYDDMFEVIWHISPDTLKYAVIKITLQPIVENCVYHGIKPKGEAGTITITSGLSEGRMVLTISDNGVGMKQEEVQELYREMNEKFQENDRHIGLYNVLQRFKIVFGEKFDFAVDSRESMGTSIKLYFPTLEL